ncbi:MAG: hypothetical protein FWG51_04625 [Firmicutes bacterium]|nr:hypothetical protein [Bacillota bacterium]
MEKIKQKALNWQAVSVTTFFNCAPEFADYKPYEEFKKYCLNIFDELVTANLFTRQATVKKGDGFYINNDPNPKNKNIKENMTLSLD